MKQALTQDKQNLESVKESLVKDKQQLEKNNQNLVTQQSNLQKKAQILEKEAKTLSQENQQLRQQSAALLAARVVQEHSQRKAMEQVKKSESGQPAVPERRKEEMSHKPAAPVLHSLGRTLTVAATEEEWETKPVKVKLATSSQQEEVTRTVADLPEIKVAEPAGQDKLFQGEDFLEKTDSFIGRMKWSIFRENH